MHPKQINFSKRKDEIHSSLFFLSLTQIRRPRSFGSDLLLTRAFPSRAVPPLRSAPSPQPRFDSSCTLFFLKKKCAGPTLATQARPNASPARAPNPTPRRFRNPSRHLPDPDQEGVNQRPSPPATQPMCGGHRRRSLLLPHYSGGRPAHPHVWPVAHGQTERRRRWAGA
jgi:hypothetical protein